MRTRRAEKPWRIIWIADNGLCQWIEFARGDGESFLDTLRARILRRCVTLNQDSPDPRYRSNLPNVFSHCEWEADIAYGRDNPVIAMGVDRSEVARVLCEHLQRIMRRTKSEAVAWLNESLKHG